ncbi:hypothetical protein DFH09DRAFT_1312415 [Mycena vulgaris]|nr:hypothetical protein DFH09DRAFT_1312415 [Mycena vulgaris]
MCFDDSVLDAFQTVPRLSPITHYNGDLQIWQDHTAVLEQLHDAEENRLTMAENENDKILNLPKLRKLYVACGDLLEFGAPLLEKLIVEPLKMTLPPDVFRNLSGLIHRSHCRLTKVCLIGAIPPIPMTSRPSPSGTPPLAR